MPETLTHEQPRLYPSRSGERIHEFVEKLSRPPETPLTPAQRERVILFEEQLIAGAYQRQADGIEVRAHEERSLERVVNEGKYLATRHEVTAEYFLTAEGREAARELGMVYDDSVATPEDVLLMLRTDGSADVSGEEQAKKRKRLSTLAQQSREWATEELVRELTNDSSRPEFTRAMIFGDTAKLRNAVQSLEAYRTLCLQVHKDLSRAEMDVELSAKHDIAELYLEAINGHLASLYPDMLWAWDQAAAAGDQKAKRDLREAWPGVERFATVSPLVRQHFIRALDQLRNGTAYDKDGHPTAINEELTTLFSGESPDLHETGEVRGGRFTAEEHAKLAKVVFDADGMQAFCKDILDELGLLSSEHESSYVKDRSSRAADGKWQVVQKPEASAMGAEDPEGVLEIPTKFKRSLTKVTAPVGVISGAAHEIAHIYQLNNARNNKGSLKLAMRVRGRSSLVAREAGGVYVEHLVQNELFGVTRPDSPHYMRALQIIEAGGGEKAAIRAFYESYQAANPTESPEASIKVAESRVMRLCRRYGGYNSQPLNYAQTAAFVAAADTMTEEQRAQIFAEGAFDLPDMAKLHQYGLLATGAVQFPAEQFCDIVERKLRKLLRSLDEESTRTVVG